MPDKTSKAVVNGWSYQVLAAAQKAPSSFVVDEVRDVLKSVGIKVSADFVKGVIDRLINVGWMSMNSVGVYAVEPLAVREFADALLLEPDLWKDEFRANYREAVVRVVLGMAPSGWFNAEALAMKTGMSVTTVREACHALRKADLIEHRRATSGTSGRPMDEFSHKPQPGDDPLRDDDDLPGEPLDLPTVNANPAIPAEVVAGMLDADADAEKGLLPQPVWTSPPPAPIPVAAPSAPPVSKGTMLVTLGHCPACKRAFRVTRKIDTELPAIECLCTEKVAEASPPPVGDPCIGTTQQDPVEVRVYLSKDVARRLDALGLLTNKVAMDLAKDFVEKGLQQVEARLRS